jgi:hypothetical protein
MDGPEQPGGFDRSGAPTFWERPSGSPQPPVPISRRRYVVAVLYGAVIVFTSANALIDWFHIDFPILPAFVLGTFAAGWNTKARTLRAWIVVGVLTSATAVALALVVSAAFLR